MTRPLTILGRRLVMKWLLAGGAAAGLSPAGVARASAVRCGEDRLARRLTSLVGAPASARRLGEAYLAQAPGEADRRVLVARICAPLGGRAQLDRLAPAALHRRVRDRVRADFAEGRLVALDGWLLSATEARLYALHV